LDIADRVAIDTGTAVVVDGLGEQTGRVMLCPLPDQPRRLLADTVEL
jgi:hypothetical protein